MCGAWRATLEARPGNGVAGILLGGPRRASHSRQLEQFPQVASPPLCGSYFSASCRAHYQEVARPASGPSVLLSRDLRDVGGYPTSSLSRKAVNVISPGVSIPVQAGLPVDSRFDVPGRQQHRYR